MSYVTQPDNFQHYEMFEDIKGIIRRCTSPVIQPTSLSEIKGNKRHSKPKGKSRMANPKTMATLDIQDTVQGQTKHHTEIKKKGNKTDPNNNRGRTEMLAKGK